MKKNSSKYFSYLFAILLSCSPKSHIIRYDDNFLSIDSTLTPDSLITAEIVPYKVQFSKIMDEVLAYSEQAMYRDQPEGLLGNFTRSEERRVGKECRSRW